MGLATNHIATDRSFRSTTRKRKLIAIIGALCMVAISSHIIAAELPNWTTDEFPSIKVTSPDGQPVNGAQVIVRRKSDGFYSQLKWLCTDVNGLIRPEMIYTGDSPDGIHEMIARVPGYMTASVTETLPTSSSVINLRLSPGKQVTLQLNDAAGRPFPKELRPAVFPESWGMQVWMTVPPTDNNIYAPETLLSPIAVISTVENDGAPGEYTLNIDPKSTEPLYILVNQPGFMRGFQAGPFMPADWASSETLEVTLPKPASLSGSFDLNGNIPKPPVVAMQIETTHDVPGKNAHWRLELITEITSPTAANIATSDLAPGKYTVTASIKAKGGNDVRSLYSTDKTVDLASGESETLTLKYDPFQKEWLQGPYTAKIKIQNLNGEPAVGLPYELTWSQRGYGQQTVAEGTVPTSGVIEIKGLAGLDKPMTRMEAMKLPHGSPFFVLSTGSNRLGGIYFFDDKDGKIIPDTEMIQEFTFNIPPQLGDPAPDFAMHDIVTSKTIHLSDFKGQTVLIDFWATWCGPCQGPMAENQEIMRKHKEDWKGKAVILAVSIDDDLDTVMKHLDKKDWHETHNAWAAPDRAKPDEVGWQAPAAKLYGINSIPTMVLIGPDGVIRERGHMNDVEAAMEKVIKSEKSSDAKEAENAKDTKDVAPERKGGGDLIKIPVEKIRPPSAETDYSKSNRASSAAAKAPIKAPSTETHYSAGRVAAPKPIRVALFVDPGSTGETSRRVTWKVLSDAPGITPTKVTAEDVRAPGFFDNFDVFILPGGSGGGEAKAVGVEAGKAIAQEVKAGKGLIGICAGGYYLAEGWNPATAALDIINAKNNDGDHWARGEQFIAVKVVGTGADDAASSRTIWYENGPIFKPADIDGLPAYVPLVQYVTDLAKKDAPKGQMGGYDAIIAAPYGQGRVVAFGPHPERTPELNHWLINAIEWAAGRRGDGSNINANVVLEGRGE